MRRSAVLLAGAALVASAAAAQRLPDISQISDQKPQVAVPDVPASAAEEPDQISSEHQSRSSEVQLTAPTDSREQPKQLSHGPPTAQAPTPLSRPSEGRTAKVERVEGNDRCDPAIAKDKQPPECKRVIESRADDYSKEPEPELTPEQRLLIDQQAREALSDATHRLATTGDAGNSPDSMAIASIVLDQSQPKPEPKKEEEDPTTQAAVQAIIQLITQAPQQ